MSNNIKNIAVIGGGIAGLAAAYYLSKAGHKITIYEAGDRLGGLLSGFRINQANLEKAYHHIFKTDEYMIDFVNELGIKDKLIWLNSSIGIYYKNNIYRLSSPFDLFKFKPLNIIEKLRLGIVVLYLKLTPNWQRLTNIRAAWWLKKWCGENAYNIVWLPLLKGKFHDYYQEISLAWFWARINTRGNSTKKGEEVLGYFKGGWQTLIDAIEQKLKQLNVNIHLNTKINKITAHDNKSSTFCSQKVLDKVTINIGTSNRHFDKVVCTIPTNVFSQLIKNNNLPNNYLQKLNSIDYLGAIMLIFSSKQSLSKYYWHNIHDLQAPFLAIIQHTNLIDKVNYGNEHIYYLGTYLPHDHRYFQLVDNVIYSEFFVYLKKIFPNFNEKEIHEKHLFKLKHAQQIVDTNYEQKIPDYKTPLPNIYLANFSQIYPHDRGTNLAIREGINIAQLIK